MIQRTGQHREIRVIRHKVADAHFSLDCHKPAPAECEDDAGDVDAFGDHPRVNAFHIEGKRGVECGAEHFRELAAFRSFLAERFDDFNSVDRFRKACRNFRHPFPEIHGDFLHGTPEIGEIQGLKRHEDQADQRKFRAHGDQSDDDAGDREQVNDEVHENCADHAVEHGNVGQDIGDQLAGAVFLIETQREALEVLEKFHPHTEQNPVSCVVKQIMADVEKNLAEDVNDKDSAKQETQQSEIGTAESPVDDQFQKPRHRHTQRRED